MIIAFILITFFLCVCFLFLAAAVPATRLPEKEPKECSDISKTNVGHFENVDEDIDDIFIGFIGNEQAVESIKRLIKYAKINGFKKLPNIGLFGPRSTGKTELQRRIARAMGIPVLVLSKSTINNEETFFKQVSKEIEGYSGGNLVAPPMIVFIDEVHLLSRRIQDSLLTALESDDRCFRTKHGDIDTTNITFIVATTDPGKLSQAFVSRLIIFNLKTYSESEIVKMLQSRMMSDESIDECALLLEDSSLNFIAKASRLIPRKAIEILKQASYAIATGATNSDHSDVSNDIKKMFGCDDNGMTEEDKKYLSFLLMNGPTGLSTLSSFLDTDKDNVESFIEPWLITNGYIIKTPKGRQITQKGKQLVS